MPGVSSSGSRGATPAPSPIPLRGDPDPDDDIEFSDLGRVLQADELPDAAVFLPLKIYGRVDFGALELPVD